MNSWFAFSPCFAEVVETDVEDEVVWVQEEEKQDYYTWSSTGTETESDGEPKRNEKNWESHGETSDSEATDNSNEEIDDGSQGDVR